jgi:hypothetical protein
MKLITIGRRDSLSISMSWPSPPWNRPRPPEPDRMRLKWKKSGLLRSATSTGVLEILLGQESTCSPSFPAVAPMPPLKKSTVVYGRPSSRTPDWATAQRGDPAAAATRSGITWCSAPRIRIGT